MEDSTSKELSEVEKILLEDQLDRYKKCQEEISKTIRTAGLAGVLALGFAVDHAAMSPRLWRSTFAFAAFLVFGFLNYLAILNKQCRITRAELRQSLLVRGRITEDDDIRYGLFPLALWPSLAALLICLVYFYLSAG